MSILSVLFAPRRPTTSQQIAMLASQADSCNALQVLPGQVSWLAARSRYKNACISNIPKLVELISFAAMSKMVYETVNGV